MIYPRFHCRPHQAYQRIFLGLAIALALLMAVSSHANPIVLSNAQHRIVLDPNTLNIEWNRLLVNAPYFNVNQQKQTAYHPIVNDANNATWQLRPSGIKATATLDENALLISFLAPQQPAIRRAHPMVLEWFHLANQQTDTLFLPFSEGMRIPTNNTLWARYLVDNHHGANTTQDLKMPFWTIQQGHRYINYQLITATNNTLGFTRAQPHIGMSAQHQFTPLNQAQPFTVRITLGDHWIDGAKHYRQWRIDNQQSKPLSQQHKANPQIEKLIGASQVYVFGRGLISTLDVIDWSGLKHWYLKQSGLSISQSVLKSLGSASGPITFYEKQRLVNSINASLQLRYPTPRPTLNNNTIAAQYKSAQQQKQWLKAHASDYLVASQRWGQALTLDMVDNLTSAGLNKLWLGLDNWMPAFYQPEVVDKAKDAGFLVATYDSYNTAIPQGINDSWLTAQLPDPMRNECAIEMADGHKKKGFRGKGFYLNPNCQINYVKQRILDIVHYGHFNSLFLDVDATAMAREDYRDNSDQQAMLNAFNQRMAWIAKQHHLVLGSEDGNSLTTSGIAFAHGLETVGFGWTDAEMKQDTSSPYFLGRWYPDHKPDFFFTSAQVNEPYRTLLFDPRYRVPMYQAVFHDEVINSHHWHSDSLKFSNVKTQRDLTSMLYNTPAMVHLSRDEASSVNSPRIQALAHYQQGFSPVHQQLWDQQLIDLVWLDENGLIQQSVFSDGSKIIANFTNSTTQQAGVSMDSYSMLALLSNGQKIRWQVTP
ncbi:glycoside hydrolase [Vibrio ostreicida]|uniref:Glycoside hydrolase n=1 Tax=Vibrio ostreicida TaxID=526588 RepID=A0ABT8BXQ8_9VIBR|nr:glycoside hydrolase [Vibrio ostreicida]MDN3611940.1 glycoside hydrolase [Vibrio ostreicida]NPD08880.1 glycoside hydrolase [Vibrio ostreicida]